MSIKYQLRIKNYELRDMKYATYQLTNLKTYQLTNFLTY